MISWRQRLRKAVGVVDTSDVLFAIGVGALAYGAHQVYAPAGWIVAGAVFVWLGLPTRPFPIVFVRHGKQE